MKQQKIIDIPLSTEKKTIASFIYYKIPFEGKIEAVYELIKNRDWYNISLKIPENGIIYMKVPEDVDEELIFNQDLVFDETTNSKFGIFEKITESDYEAAKNIDIPLSTEKKTIASFIYYKIPFEGKIEAVYELIKNRDWNISLKMPENGIIYMKVPEDADDEVIFNQDLVFDETTNSKFGIFEKITESDYEAAKNIEIPRPTENKTIPTSKKANEINKKIETYQQEKRAFDKEVKQIIFEEKPKDLKTNLYSGINLSDLKNMISLQNIKVGELRKNIIENYKDNYDYFLSQNYVMALFVFAVISLIIFNF